MTAEVILRATDVVKHFPVQSSGLRRSQDVVHAVDRVTLEVRQGETVGLVGETGCGKSTLARCIARLHELTSGTIEFEGRDISRLKPRQLGAVRREMQMIFQDPYGSLNPKRRVGSIIGDPFAIHHLCRGKERKRRVQETMELVGLNPEHFNRFPAEFSGGQRQRIGVARALALRPKLVICDEPVSALDVSIQAQVLNLLIDLQEELNLTYIFISHDLSVVRHVSDRLMLMYLGQVVESGPSEEVYRKPRHPYSSALLSAVPLPDPKLMAARERIVLVGDVPSPINPPQACRFHPRCPKAQARCAEEEPMLEPRLGDPPDHTAACHFPVADGEDLVAARPALPDDLRIVEPQADVTAVLGRDRNDVPERTNPCAPPARFRSGELPEAPAPPEQLPARAIEGRSTWQLAWTRLRKDRAAVASAVVILLIILMAIFAPVIAAIAGHPVNHQYRTTGLTSFGLPRAPNREFLLGTDDLGRDVLVRIAYGARISLYVGVVATLLTVAIGAVLGLMAGFLGGVVDTIIARLTDVVLSVPFLLFAISLVSVTKPGLRVVIIVIAVFGWAAVARIIRGQVLSIREKEYIEAARSLGASSWRIMFVDVLPNVLTQLIVYATLLIPVTIILEATLSFLGLGIPPPTADWGQMIAEAQTVYQQAWWFLVFPSLALLITTVAFNILGDGVRDALDPRLERL